MKVELWPIGQVKPYENNPRLNDAAVDAVARSIAAFGFKQPIVVDNDGVIIVGHTRLKAATKLGLEQVPVHVADNLTEAEVKAYRIADNQTATLASWDLEKLPAELEELRALDVDLSLLGFDEDQLAKLLDPGVKDGLCDPDQIPLPPDKATTQLGDLWVLGDHRLHCGDSASETDVDRLLDGTVIDLINMDPPYGVKVEPRSNTAIASGLSSFGTKKAQLHHQSFDRARGATNPLKPGQKMRAKDRPLEGDFLSEEEFNQSLIAWFSNAARALKAGGSFFCWGGYKNLSDYPAPLKMAGLYFSQAIIWDKQHPVLTRKDFMGVFELCFYGWKLGAGHQFYGPNNITDLWHVKKVNPSAMIHLTEKPVELAVRAMQYSSVAGERVLDLFGGSGSTLIAAEQTGRRAFLMEIDALYCDIIVARWETFTGRKAERIPDQTNSPQ